MIRTIFTKLKNIHPLILLAGIVFFAGVLRLVNLGVQPYWGDEILSLGIAHHFESVVDMLRYLSLVEVHPPLYYLLLHPWVGQFGTGEFIVRLLSWAAGLLVVVLGYLVGKRAYKSETVGLIAALLFAVLPTFLEYSQQARPYIFFTAAALIAIYAYLAYRETNRWRWLFLYIAASTTGLYLHYSYVFFFVSIASFWIIVLLLEREPNWSRRFIDWLLAQAAAAVLFVFWLPLLLSKLLLQKYLIFGLKNTTSLSADRPLSFLSDLINQLFWMNKNQITAPIEIFAIFLFKCALAVALFWLIRRALFSKERWAREATALFLWMSIIPLLLFLFSPQSIAYTNELGRHVIATAGFATLLLAYILWLLPLRYRLVLGALFFASILPFIIGTLDNDAHWNSQYRLQDIAQFINESYHPGDLILISYVFSRSDFNYYLRPDVQSLAIAPTNYYGIDLYNSRETLGFIENEIQFRIPHITLRDVGQKMERLTRDKNLKRIWITYVEDGGYPQQWLLAHGWRQAFHSPVRTLLPIDLFVRDNAPGL
ncbi:hypothetical protein COV04_00055 [Candidatus Uhrbacteria bacterium CG10_big_fil_rev_8_21_14_0_10_48_11]|uniref:Glycosyltransferase RgtA/B/C/D-like domain-containing protein n=1 Tax=Candidatus Uhrbacteria bacterium CG10_big_fil_rev_8_21_14_0_10_48_11 TaxID=1975037 RepID=A0A2M8LFN2_9BACT|nr:MAG: hypothetical protein COV04_00055 [Candidatus Uhrbacteria bacterium CG10_big_fil_rev_8_21_14_0_10_48_11]